MSYPKELYTGEEKTRIIQELVPGKQVTLAHIIANPDAALYEKLGMNLKSDTNKSAIGILSFTPAEAAIIAADISIKSSSVSLGFVDHSSGTVILSGNYSEVEEAFKSVLLYANEKLGFSTCEITKT